MRWRHSLSICFSIFQSLSTLLSVVYKQNLSYIGGKHENADTLEDVDV